MSTDTAVENVETAAPVAEAPAFNLAEQSPVVQAVGAQVAPLITEHNELAAKVVAASGNEDAIVESLKADDNGPLAEDNKKIEALENKKLELEIAREKKAREIASTMNKVDPAEVEKMTETVNELRKKIVASRTLIGQVENEEVAKALFASLPALVSHKTGKTGGTQGKGGRKIRGFDYTVDGKLATAQVTVTHTPVKGQGAVPKKDENGNNITEQVSSSRAVATALEVPNDAVMAAFFQAQGTDKSEDFKPVVEFELTGKDGNVHKIVATKRA